MRLEIYPHEASFQKIQDKLESFGKVELVENAKLAMLIDKHTIRPVIDLIQDEALNISQYSLLPPSLEDVYSKLQEQQRSE